MHVELVDIHKHYGAVKANDGVSLTVAPGSCTASSVNSAPAKAH